MQNQYKHTPLRSTEHIDLRIIGNHNRENLGRTDPRTNITKLIGGMCSLFGALKERLNGQCKKRWSGLGVETTLAGHTC
ncbi:hypothetical protein QVD17_37833 [Tagetes erecta]|uniref:Uncharacterized protein n=1 Tax=Tagetes erecta TaxID=13708 RepID=A0AAD8NK64_TARER|nr:hypothetical protein QVD17_37833 [Tagetes erecta]